jgi:ActR/RegA family two-component response regulator
MVSASELAEFCSFDVVVLDVMLPRLDGFEVARRLRRRHIQTPILMLTARDAVPDITTGLDAGADDYLTKPFAFAELLARIRALARRGPASLPTLLSVGELTLDPSTREVRRGDREIKLTATEYRLLELLMRHPDRGISPGLTCPKAVAAWVISELPVISASAWSHCFVHWSLFALARPSHKHIALYLHRRSQRHKLFWSTGLPNRRRARQDQKLDRRNSGF